MNKVCMLLEWEVGGHLRDIVGASKDEEMIDAMKHILEMVEENAYYSYEKRWVDYQDLPPMYMGKKEVLPL